MVRAVVTLGVTAVLAVLSGPSAGGLAAASTAATFPTTPLWVYGHSYTALPGVTNTPGMEWMPQLADQLEMPSWRTFGVRSSRLVDTFGDLSRQAARVPMADSAWDSGRRGVVVLQSEYNDMVNPPHGALRATRLTTKAGDNYGQTMQASLAVLSSSSRADWSTARSSGRWTSSVGPAYLGGSMVWTTTPGAYREMTVDVGASGTVWVVTWEVSRNNPNPNNGATAISVDGRTRTTLSARTAAWESIWSLRGGGSGYQHDIGPRATRITGLTPGRHTIRVTKADRGPGAICLDQLLVQSDAPPPVLVVEDPPPATSGTSWNTTPANRATIVANRLMLHVDLGWAARQFPNVAVATLTNLAPALYGRDGVHLSDAGMTYEAGLLAQTFRGLVARYDVPAMYLEGVPTGG